MLQHASVLQVSDVQSDHFDLRFRPEKTIRSNIL